MAEKDQKRRKKNFFFSKRKECMFCKQGKDVNIDYKDVDLLKRFVNNKGKIESRMSTGTCAKHQRVLAREIKKARIVALLPFVNR